MILLLTKSFHGRRIRTWLTTAGVAICTILVIVIASAFRSVRTAISDYTGQATIDLWVAPRDADNLIRGSFISFIPLADADSIRQIPGVAAADPILEAFLPAQPLGLKDPLKRLTLLTIGFKSPDGLGGPPGYFEGRAPQGRKEVALDRAAAFRLGLGVGDTIEISGYQAVIRGLTTGTNILATQFVFADFDAIAGGTNTAGQASFVLIKLAPNADRESVIAIIEKRFPNLRAYTREYFVKSNEREITAGFGPLLALVTILGVSAAALLVGLLILGVMDERRGDIAVLIALGTGLKAVGRSVLAQTALLALRGTLVGIVLSYGLEFALRATLPTIPLSIAVIDVLAIAVLFIATGIGAAVAPVFKLSAIDPLEAFRS
jgi:ABC-type lipoprotein release transport system permease subunit